MHVAILCEYGTVNGGENSILAMIEPMDTVDVTVLAPATGRLADRLSTAGLAHVPLALHDGSGRRLARDLALTRIEQAVQSVRPDLLHANSLSMGRLTGALRSQLPIPTSAHLRDIVRLSRAAVADLNGNDALLAVSRETRARHVQQGLDAERVHVLYNGIDTDRFIHRPATGALHRELGLPPSAPLVATIGQIALRKGQDLFVRAAIAAARSLPEVHWLIVGERYSGKPESVEFERQLREQIAAARMNDRVHWLGYRDDMPQLLAELDLLVHPARQEPLGRVLLEAGACGVSIVATSVGGTPEIIDDVRSGLLIPPDDPSAIASAVVSLLQDAPRRRVLGQSARASVCRRFAIQPRSAELLQHWRSVASAHTAGG